MAVFVDFAELKSRVSIEQATKIVGFTGSFLCLVSDENRHQFHIRSPAPDCY
jgi:hypothetical protein